MADELDISTAAGKAKKVTSDGHSVERHDPSELIDADRAIQANAEAKKSHGGLKLRQLRNGGTQ